MADALRLNLPTWPIRIEREKSGVLAFPARHHPNPPSTAHTQSQPQLQSGVLTARDRARIETVRALAPVTLLQSSAELEQACRLIAVDRTASLERYVMALIASLSTYATARVAIYAEGCTEYSDAEIWLARVVAAFETADTSEGRALVHWRIKRAGHRRLRFLLSGLADAFLAREA